MFDVEHLQAVTPKDRIPLVYQISRFLMRIWLILCFRYTTYEARHVPLSGACILASNHASFLDPLLVGCNLYRRFIRFMARDTLFHNRLFYWWARQVGVVMLDREKGDIGAMKSALKILKDGGALCLFPEGTRTRDGNLQKTKGGIGFLIAKAAVPVIPVYIKGSFQAFPRGARLPRPVKISVYYGTPLTPKDWADNAGSREDYERIAALVMQRIAALEQKAGASAGCNHASQSGDQERDESQV